MPDKILCHTQYVRFLTNMDFSGIVFRYFQPLFLLTQWCSIPCFFSFQRGIRILVLHILHPKESKCNWFLKTFVLQSLYNGQISNIFLLILEHLFYTLCADLDQIKSVNITKDELIPHCLWSVSVSR